MCNHSIYKLFFLAGIAVCLLQGCIKNDIDYPKIMLSITDIEAEGQKSNAVISEKDRIVTLDMEETADLRKIQITGLAVTEGAKSSLAINDIIDLSDPFKVTLSLYQDYQWNIIAKRDIARSFKVNNQIGASVIDADKRMVVAYVMKDTKWKDLEVLDFKLGPEGATNNGATGIPSLNWTAYTGYASAKVAVKYGDFFDEDWEVRVYRKDKNVDTKQADGWVQVAWLYGEGIEGLDNGFELREASSPTWEKVNEAYVTITGATFKARVPHLKPETDYVCRAYSGKDYGQELTFTTGSIAQIPNGTLNDWSYDQKSESRYLWKPWADGENNPFWDTGNKGATTVGQSNTTPVTDTWDGKAGKAAQLKSVYIVIKFAAGNLFAGEYIATDVTNGVLSFGKPFTQRPTHLKGHIKYTSVPINRTSVEFDYLKNRPDSCHIYMALGDWDKPVEIRTKDKTLFNKNDPNIIAYGEFISGKSIPQYTELNIPLVYRSTSRIPKYIVLVCTASKYGDYFTGGDGSTLWVDDFTLEYDYGN